MKKNILLLFSFFSRKERKILGGLLLLMLLAAVMEIVGLGAIFSYMKLLANQEIVLTNSYLVTVYNFLGFLEPRSFIIFVGVIIFIVMLLKGAVTCLNLYCQNKFSMHMRNKLSMQILNAYIMMPYKDSLSLNSAILSKHLIIEVSSTVASINQMLRLFTETVVSIALVAVMLYLDVTLVFFVVIVLGFFTTALIKLTKNPIAYFGRETEKCNALMFKSAFQVLQGLKEIKTFNVEKFFSKEFKMPLFRSSSMALRVKMLSGFPGIIVNIMSYGALLAILLYLFFTRGNLASILPLIGAFGVALHRLLPAVDKIYNAVALIRKYEPGVGIIRRTLDILKVASRSKITISQEAIPLSFTHSIRFQNVSFIYPGSQRKALNNITFKIIRNSSVAVVGNSGAGKSTLVDVLLGLLPASEGNVWCDDILLNENNRLSFSHMVGYVPQQTFLIDDTIRANIVFGIPKEQIDDKQLANAISAAQLADLISQLPQGLDTNIGERGVKLSGGQRQRIAIARQIYRNAQILIFDEATSALDAESEFYIKKSIDELKGNKTIIMIAHRLSTIKDVDYIYVLDEGRLTEEGTFKQLYVEKSTKFYQMCQLQTF